MEIDEVELYYSIFKSTYKDIVNNSTIEDIKSKMDSIFKKDIPLESLNILHEPEIDDTVIDSVEDYNLIY